MSLENFIHIYIDNNADKTLVLLHGTGADEYDLLPLVKEYKNNYNFLSLRGNISEHGMNRFFKRTAPGVFDKQSIEDEAKKLDLFLEAFKTKNSLSSKDLTFLGYSNGANMILALVLLYPQHVHNAILLHAMMPLDISAVDLSGTNFLVTYGENDQMILASESRIVSENLQNMGARVEVEKHPGGHEIRSNEVKAIANFLNSKAYL